MSDPVAYLTTCATCGGYPAASWWVTDVPQPHPWHCPKCRPGLILAEDLAVVGAEVGLIDRRAEARFVVLARDGDTVTVRPLGLTSFPSTDVSTAEIRPKFSYERLAASRRR
jgi:hypothetical protein